MRKPTNGTSEKQGRISSDNYQEYWSSFDLGCSATLVSKGYELVSLDRSEPKKIKFYFKREAGIEKVVDDYFADRVEVKARTLFDNIKAIKNKMYSSE